MSAKVAYFGSSPRMRGTPSTASGARDAPGLIPAYAGNTQQKVPPSGPLRAHPRVCGEHSPGSYKASGMSGSSPRMRGTHDGVGAPTSPEGLIPAYAGNTLGRRVKEPHVSAHPRVCGEHKGPTSMGRIISGSSPRMRGTRHLHPPRGEPVRLIPAYAGNTYWPGHGYCSESAHPRVCGEHLPALLSDHFLYGSSPRMRGTHLFRLIEHFLPRLIPAYAGNTRTSSPR